MVIFFIYNWNVIYKHILWWTKRRIKTENTSLSPSSWYVCNCYTRWCWFWKLEGELHQSWKWSSEVPKIWADFQMWTLDTLWLKCENITSRHTLTWCSKTSFRVQEYRTQVKSQNSCYYIDICKTHNINVFLHHTIIFPYM